MGWGSQLFSCTTLKCKCLIITGLVDFYLTHNKRHLIICYLYHTQGRKENTLVQFLFHGMYYPISGKESCYMPYYCNLKWYIMKVKELFYSFRWWVTPYITCLNFKTLKLMMMRDHFTHIKQSELR